MKRLLEFAKTTTLGGLVVLTPVVVLAVLFKKAVDAAQAALSPITMRLPDQVALPAVVAVIAVIAVAFVTGLVVRSPLGRRVQEAIERKLLNRIPGYAFLRTLSRQALGDGDVAQFHPALVEIEDAYCPAFVIEEHADGRVTVFVPSAPTPTMGSIYIMAKERVHRVDASFAKTVRCITRWGLGSGELLRMVATETGTRSPK